MTIRRRKRLTINGNNSDDTAFSADGRKIAFGYEGDIYVMNADGTDQVNVTNMLDADFEPAFAPDGGKIAFTSTRDGNPEIFIMNADGTDQTNLTQDIHIDRRPAFSPDGSRIIEELTTYLRGWLGYFGRGEDYWTLRDLDSWIRRRLRAAAWRAWRLPRKRFRELVRRGATFGEAAIAVRRFRHPWRASLDRALTVALPESLWTKLGLLNLQRQWRAMNT